MTVPPLWLIRWMRTEMYDGTLIDHFDAYVSDAASNEIKAVILGTTYGAGGTDGTVTKTVTLDNAAGTQAQVTVLTQTTSMYTATETYTDRITVPAILADYETVRQGAVTQIQFTVENNGIHAINKLNFTVGDVTEYDNLNLLPGNNIQLYADYTIPKERVVDPEYIVTAEFGSDGASGSAHAVERQGLRRSLLNEANGTVYLNLPDIEITKAEIVEEVNGKRTIYVLLNNDSDADLKDSGCTVKIGFYTDAAHTILIDGLDSVTITRNSDFAMIDEGGYSIQVVFDIQSYLEKAELDEIPESGITVYMMVQVFDEHGKVQGEPISSNNFDSIFCESLKVRTGKEAIVTSTLTNDENGSTVTVNLQNTRLSETYIGNIIVTLLDVDGNVLGQKQSYNGTDGLITLTGEQKKTVSFSFNGEEYKRAASAEVVYSDLIIGADNANLVSLSFSNLPGITLDRFTESASTPGIYRASVSADDLTSTAVMAVAESGLAKIKLSDTDEGSNAVSQTVALQPGKIQDITITVTNGTESKTYILTIQNNGEPIIDYPTGTPEPSDPNQYSASTFYAANEAIISLNAAASPESGYALTYQWYSCEADGGETWIEATADNFPAADMTVTLPYPSETDRYNYNFYLKQLVLDPPDTDKTVGKIETVDITLTQFGIRFTANCLPTLVVGWSLRPMIIPIINDAYVEDTEHGTLEISRKRALFGTEVTVTVVPDDGYVLESLTVTDANGKRIICTDNGNGTYTFKMPAVAVTVTPVFKTVTLDEPGICNGTAADHCPSLAFADLDTSAWYHLNVDYVMNNGLMNGMGGGIFAPNGKLSRAMLVTILWRMEGEPIQSSSADFTDVATGQWYTAAVHWASANGIVDGYGNGYFGTNDAITCEQFVTIMFRYAKYKGYDVSSHENTNILSYDDAFEVADWALPAMQWACGSGMIQGIADGNQMNLAPQGNATRAQAAAILQRFCQNVAKEN